MEIVKNRVYKKQVQMFIFIISLIGMLISLLMIFKSFSLEKLKNELYNYSYNSDLNYKVYLKENEFFKNSYLGMNKEYISSLIDKVEAEFKYNFQSSKDLDYVYSYEINAHVKGLFGENGGSEIWSDTYQLFKSDEVSGTGKTISINKLQEIDYNAFNDVMNNFKTKFGLSVDSRADIEFKINITASVNGEKSKTRESNTITLQMPLLKQTVQFTPSYVNHGNKVVYGDSVSSGRINFIKLSFGLVLFIASIYGIIILAPKVIKTSKKSEYESKLNKILKEYGDIIAESRNLPNLLNYDMVTINEFKDLVDIEEELRIPMLYKEVRKGVESWFIILHDKTAYRYVLKVNEKE